MTNQSPATVLRDCHAVIFDMDGVIVDTEPLKFAAYKAVFRDTFHIELPETDISWRGRTENEVMSYWLNKFGLEADVASLIVRKRAAYQLLLETTPLSLTLGLRSFLSFLRDSGRKCGLATGSIRDDQQAVLGKLELRFYFDAIVTRDDIAESKPDPKIYRSIAQELKVQPERCLVFEDSPAGISAAKASGMYCVGLTTSFTKTELCQADFIISDFACFEADMLLTR